MNHQYIQKPVRVEARQWLSVGDHPSVTEHPGIRFNHLRCVACGKRAPEHGMILVYEIENLVCPGDWIVSGTNLPTRPYKQNEFHAEFTPYEELA